MQIIKAWKLKKNTKVKIPLYGEFIHASIFGTQTSDDVEDHIDLNELLLRDPTCTYLVQAEGDSMKEAGIFSRDFLIVDCGLEARSGCIVAVYLNGEMTVKQYYHDFKRTALISANHAHKDIELFDGMNFQIVGVVIHSFRSFPY